MPAYCIVYANPTYMVANKLIKEDGRRQLLSGKVWKLVQPCIVITNVYKNHTHSRKHAPPFSSSKCITPFSLFFDDTYLCTKPLTFSDPQTDKHV